jgi:hypothetical protein
MVGRWGRSIFRKRQQWAKIEVVGNKILFLFLFIFLTHDR